MARINMKIKSKAFLFILLLSISLLSVFALIVQWSLAKGMVDYVNAKEAEQFTPLIESLAIEYQKNRSWQFIEGEHREFHQKLRTALEGTEFALPTRPEGHSERFGHRPPHKRRFDDKRRPLKDGRHPPPRKSSSNNRGSAPNRPEPKVSYAIVDADKNYVVGRYHDNLTYSYTPITVANAVVGFLAISKRESLVQGYELDFVSQQQSYLWVFALGVFVLALLVALPVAKYLLKPLHLLAKGMHELTQGNYDQRLDAKETKRRNDELSQLIQDFNELAKTLDSNDAARKRWLANISHELRTPVAILNGEIEAMIDGIRPFDQSNLESLHQEIAHLRQLIDDLNALTSADIGGMTYRKNNLDINTFLVENESKYRHFLETSQMSLQTDITDNAAIVFADKTRMHQLMDNLIGNCAKYAGEGSQVKLSLSNLANNEISLTIEDSGVGVADEHLEHLFEHLYRVDDSRNRETGGTGLGLSICAHIVNAHEGTINASRSDLGGLKVSIVLPVS